MKTLYACILENLNLNVFNQSKKFKNLITLFFISVAFIAQAQSPKIEKFTDNPIVQSGETIIYSMTANCDGLTIDCPNFVVCDEIPLFTTFGSAPDATHPDTGLPVPGVLVGTQVCWDFGLVTAGSAAIIDLTVTVDNGYLPDDQKITNEAEVSSGGVTEISNPVETNVNSQPRWNISKSSPGNVFHGDNVTFNIQVCNSQIIGSQNLTGATITDVLPPGAEFVSAPGGTYAMGTNTVTWNLGDLDINDPCTNVQLVVVFPLGPPENDTGMNPGTNINKVNTATLDGTSPDGPYSDSDNGTAVLNPPFFQVTSDKEAGDLHQLVVDSINQFTITFGNSSTKPLDNFTVCDAIPTQFTLDSISFESCNSAAPQFTIDLLVSDIGSEVIKRTETLGPFSGSGPVYVKIEAPLVAVTEYVHDLKLNFGTVPRGWGGCEMEVFVTDAYYPDGGSPTAHSDNAGLPIELCTPYENCVEITGMQQPMDGGALISSSNCDYMSLQSMNTARLDPYKSQAVAYENPPAGQTTTGNPYYPGARVQYCITVQNDGPDDETGSFNNMVDPVASDLFPNELLWSAANTDWWVNSNNTGRAYPSDGTNPTITTEYNANIGGMPSDSTRITWRFLDDFVPNDNVEICFYVTIDPNLTTRPTLINSYCLNSNTPVSCDENEEGKPSNTPASGTAYNSTYYLDANDLSENPDVCCKSVSLTVVDTSSRPEIIKSVVSSGPYYPNGIPGGTDTIEYQLVVENDRDGNYIMIDPIIADLISDKTCAAGTFEIVSNNTGIPFTNDGINPIFLIQDDYQGSGQQFMTWHFDGDFPIGTSVTIGYKVGIKAGQSDVINNAASLFVPEKNTCTNPTPDIFDLNENGSTTDLICQVSGNSFTSIATAVGLSAEKFIYGCEERFLSHPDTATILPGQPFTYKLQLANPGNVGIDELIIIDILPFVGDMGVRVFEAARGSEWRPLLMGPVTANINGGTATTYYSTSGDPCRDIEEILDPGENTDCTAPGWTTTPADFSTIQSIKFEIDPSFVLAPLDTLSFTFDMLNPAIIPPGAICNSFAWKGNRADNGRRLRAEPKQVCAQVKKDTIGNYVWVDVNEDGLQDGTDIPLEGVTMALFDPQGNLVATTLTDASGEYYFTSSNDPNQTWTGGGLLEFLLPDSTYYVVAAYNENNGIALNVGGTDYILTLEDAGMDDALDSDGSLAEAGDPAFLDGYIFQEMNTDTIGADYTFDFGFYEGGFDLALTKILSASTPGPFFPGSPVTFNLTIENQGDFDAYGVNINDYIPTGLVLDDPNWIENVGVASLLNPIAFIPIGGQAIVTITFTIANDFQEISITNNAEISEADSDTDPNNEPPYDVDSTPGNEDGSVPDPNDDDVADETGGDDYDPETIVIIQEFDLALTKVYVDHVDLNGDGNLNPGESANFDITVYNQGTLDATGVEVTDYVPSDFIFNQADNATFSEAVPGSSTAPIAMLGTILPGESATVSITLEVDLSFQGDLIINDAEITAANNALGEPDEDSTPNDNSGNASEISSDNDIDDEAEGTPGTQDNIGDSDDFDPAPVMVFQTFDLAINKVIDIIETPGPYFSGDPVNFNITVFNQGNLDATDIVVTDYLPTGMNFVSSPDFTLSGVQYYANIPSLAAGTSIDLEITLEVDIAFMGTQLINNAEIVAGENALGLTDQDDDLGNINGSSDDASEIITDNDYDDEAVGTPGTNDNPADVDDYDPALIEVVQIFDLALEKVINMSETPGPYGPGDDITFEIEVWNQGTLDAYNIELLDYFDPSELVLNDDNWSAVGPGEVSLNNDIDYIGSGEFAAVNITFTINPNYQGLGDIINYAEIAQADDDNNPNNTFPVDADSVPGNNQGDDELANDGELVDTDTGELQDDDLDSDDYDPAFFPVEQEFDLALMKSYTTWQDDNNDGLISVGEKVDFTITVYNQGTIDATDVEVTDYVPADLIFNQGDNIDFSSLAPGSLTAPIATMASIPKGGSASVVLTLMVDPLFMGSMIYNDAEITDVTNALGLADQDSTPGDNQGDPSEMNTDNDIDDEGAGTPGTADNPNDADDYDPAPVFVGQVFDLALFKVIDPSVNPGPYFPGDVVGFTIEVWNQGTLDATNVIVEDYIPNNMNFVSSPDFTVSANQYTATIASIPAGTMVTLSLNLEIDEFFQGDYIVNNAEIINGENELGLPDQDDNLNDIDGSSDDESELGTNDDIDDEAPGTPGATDNPLDVDDYDPAYVSVTQIFDLALEKTFNSSNMNPIVPGSEVTFNVEVTNQGTKDAYNVKLKDYYLVGELILNDINWTESVVGVAESNNVIPFIGIGESVLVTITFTVDPSFMGIEIINYAEILEADDNDNPGDGFPTDADSTPDNNQGDDELANDGELVDSETGALQDDDPDSDDYDPAPITITQDFDLALDKILSGYDDANSNGKLDAGENVNFTITVYNQGTIDAQNIEVTDYVPADMIYNAVDNVDFSDLAPATSTTPVATIASLPSGTNTTVEITLQVNPTFMGLSIVNDAEITLAENLIGQPDADSTPGNNQGDPSELDTDNDVDDEAAGTPGTEDNINDSDDYDPAEVTVNQTFDLAIDKIIDTAATPSPYEPGDAVEFIINVHNQGTVDATDIVVEDYLPTGMNFVAGDFTLNGSQYLATIPSLLAGQSTQLFITLQIDPSFMGSYVVNNVEILAGENALGLTDQDDDLDFVDGSSDDESELDTDNNIDDDSPLFPGTEDNALDIDDYDPAYVQIGQIFDLALEKVFNSANADPIVPGTEVTFTVTVYNQGTIDAYNVRLKDYFIPEELNLSDANWTELSSGVAESNNVIGLIGPNQSASMNITFTVDPDFMGTDIVNYAEISEADDDNDPTNTYPVDEDSVPDNNEGDDELANDGELVDSETGALQDDDLDSDDYDPAPITITQDFDLALVKILSGYDDANNNNALDAGENVNFIITVYNQGTLDAQNIEVTDYVPADMIFNAVDNVDFSDLAPATSTTPIATIASLASGASTTFAITLQVDPAFKGVSIVNDAEITLAENLLGEPDEDSTPGNNQGDASELETDNDVDDEAAGTPGTEDNINDSDDYDPAEVTVNQTFDLAIDKVIDTGATPGPYVPGDAVEFIINVHNQGTVDATDIVVEDYLPSGMNFVAGDFTLNGSQYLSTIPSLLAGQSTQLFITLEVDPTFMGSYVVNNVEIIGGENIYGLIDQDDDLGSIDGSSDDESELDTDNNIDDESPLFPGTEDNPLDIDDYDPAYVPVVQVFDLALEKTFNTAVNNPIVPGTDVTFNVEVTNQGTLDAYNVKLKDYFIIGELILNDISWNETAAGVAEANNVIPFIGIGESVTTTITFTVDPSFMGTMIVNYAEISEADDDNNPLNGFADDADSTPDNNQGDDELANDGELVDSDTGALQDDDLDSDDYDPAPITVNQDFDLALIKTYSSFDDVNVNGVIDPGENVTFEISVYNQGTLDATDVMIMDYVPTDMIYNQADNAEFSDALPGSATSPFALITNIASGEHATVSIVLQVNPLFMGTSIVNNAEIVDASNALDEPDEDSTPGDDFGNDAELGTDNELDDEAPGTPGTEDNINDSDDYDPAEITVNQIFDLAITKVIDLVATPGPYLPGSPVEFVITVYNQGNLDATDIVVEDYIPTGMNFVSSVDFALDGAEYLATIPALAANTEIQLSIILEVDPFYMGSSLVNNVEIVGASNAIDAIDQDNDLAVQHGSSDDDSELDTDNDVDDEAPGTPGTEDNPLDIDDYDPALVLVDQVFDLALEKLLSGQNESPFRPGDNVTFTIEVTNQGTVDAWNIELNDYFIPEELTLNDENWELASAGVAVLSEDIDFIGIGEMASVPITFTINSDFMGTEIINYSEIARADNDNNPNNTYPTDADSTPDNNQGDDELANDGEIVDTDTGALQDDDPDSDDYDPELIDVIQEFDLALIKEMTGFEDSNGNGILDPGENVYFEITIYNQGTLDAFDVLVGDYVPTDMIYNAGDNATFDGAAQTLIPFIGSGEEATVGLTLQIDPLFQGTTIVNNAEIIDATNLLGADDQDSTPNDNGGDDPELESDNDVDDEAPGTPGNEDNPNDSDDFDPAEVVIGQTFDLAIQKIVTSVGPYSPGDEVDYLVTVYNQGTLDATDIVVEDYLPSGMNFVSSPDFALIGAQYLATIPFLAAGDSYDLSLSLEIDISYMGTNTINNVEIIGGENELGLTDQDDDLADVDGISDDDSELDTDNDIDDEADGTPGTEDNVLDVDDYDPAEVQVEQIFDLALVKTLGSPTDSPLYRGGTVTFNVEVFNQGTVDAYNVLVNDYFNPDELILTDGLWMEVSPGVAVLNNEIDFIASGLSEVVSIEFMVKPTYMGTEILNNAEIRSADNDDDPNTPSLDDEDSVPNNEDGTVPDPNDNDVDDVGGGDDYDPATVEVTQIFDLALIKQRASGQDEFVDPGDPVEFTITIFNQGTLTADNIVITDYVPFGFTFDSGEQTNIDYGWNLAAPNIETTLSVANGLLLGEGLEPEAEIQINVVLHVAHNAPQGETLVNFAEISSATDSEDNPGNDWDSDADADPTNDNYNDPLGDDVIDNTGNDQDDHDPAEITTNMFDLALTKSRAAGQAEKVAPSELVNFMITIYNQGTIAADNIEISDYIPSCFTLEDADWSGGPTGTVTYTASFSNGDLGPEGLAPGGLPIHIPITLRVVADAEPGCDLENWAEISNHTDLDGDPIDDYDSTPDDNQFDDIFGGDDEINNLNDDQDDHDPASVELLEADLALVKRLADGQAGVVMAGELVTFTIYIENQGEVAADNIEITDYIPTHLLLEDADWSGPPIGPAVYTMTVADGDLDFGGLLPGDFASVDISMRVSVDAPQDEFIVNWAEISDETDENGNPFNDVDSDPDNVDGNDPPGEDDIDDAEVMIMNGCDLALRKECSQFVGYGDGTGGEVTFTLTIFNQGNCDAYDILVIDYIKEEDWELIDDDWFYNSFTGNAYYLFQGPLLRGDQTSFDITFRVTEFDPLDAPVNYAEIYDSEEPDGTRQIDVDSDGDDNPGNDGIVIDNEIDNFFDDEDDHDLEELKIIDLAIEKNLLSSEPYYYGQDLEFEICIINEGNMTVSDVVIEDNIPVGLRYVAGGDNDGWIGSGEQVSYTFEGEFEGGEQKCKTLTLILEDGGKGLADYTNVVEIVEVIDEKGNVSYGDWDSTPDNDDGDQSEDDEDNASVEFFDLALRKVETSVGPYRYGNEVVFTFEIENQGSIQANNIDIVDYLPCGFKFNGSGDWYESGDVLKMTLAGPIEPGEGTTVQLTLEVQACADQAATAWTNYAEIESDYNDIDSEGDDDPTNECGLFDNVIILTCDYCQYTVEVPMDDGIVPGGFTNGIVDISSAGGTLPLDYPYVLQSEDDRLRADLVRIGYNLEIEYTFNLNDGPQAIINIVGEEVLVSVSMWQAGTYNFEEPKCGDEDDHDVEEIEIFDLAQIKKLEYNGPYQFGDHAEFVITVFNQANTAAKNIVINDYLQDGFLFDPSYVHPVGLTPNANASWNQVGDIVSTTLMTGMNSLLPGESIDIVIYLEVVEYEDADGWYNYSEIGSATDEESEETIDADSDPDNDNTNDGPIKDDEINNDENDEDDHDIEGITVAGDIGDYVWKDLNGDGIQDQDEPGISKMTVRLYTCEGELLETQVTDDNGYYLFENYNPDYYYIEFINTEVYCSWTLQDQGENEELDSDVGPNGITDCFLTVGGDTLSFDAGLIPLAGLGDYVWLDANGDGIQDTNELGIEDIQVNLYDDVTGDLVAITYTDEDGYYLFEGLPPGHYYLSFEVPEGYDLSPANQGISDNLDSDVDGSNGENTTASTWLDAGEYDPSWDAGLYTCVEIGDYVWLDLNENSLQDPNENGINGVKVEIYKIVDGLGVLVDYTYTGHKPGTPSDDGYYKFCVPPGEYYVKFVLQSESLTPVTPNSGSDEIDSDITGDYGPHTTPSFSILVGGMNCDMDGGYRLINGNQNIDNTELTTAPAGVYGLFQGESKTKFNQLSFEAKAASPSELYTIERRVKGSDKLFNSIAQILSNGMEEVHTYELKDYDVENDSVYEYKLLKVDELLNETELDRVVIKTRAESLVIDAKLYPNPASSELNIEIELSSASEVRVIMTNTNGQLIKDQMITKQMSRGNNKYTLDISKVPAGFYTVKIIAQDETIDKKLVVINN